jgi:hypothetical protein
VEDELAARCRGADFLGEGDFPFGFWPTTSFIVMARKSVHLLNIGCR